MNKPMLRSQWASPLSARTSIVAGVWFALLLSSIAQVAAQDAVLSTEDGLRLVAAKCSECHGDGDKAEGDISLLQYTNDADIRNGRETWLNVRRALETGEMPPPDAAQPSEQERQQLLAWIDSVLLNQAPGELPDPGRAVMRRLTRLEYNNTVRDLFGLKEDVFEFPERLPLRKDYFDPAAGGMPTRLTVATYEYGEKRRTLLGQAGLPGDSRADHGFNNRGDVMNVSPLLIERYLQLGKSIVENPRLAEKSAVADRLMTEPQLPTVSHLVALLPLWLGLFWLADGLQWRRPLTCIGAIVSLLFVLRVWKYPGWTFDVELCGWGMLSIGAAISAFSSVSSSVAGVASSESRSRMTLFKAGVALSGLCLICAIRGPELSVLLAGVAVAGITTLCHRPKAACHFLMVAGAAVVAITMARGGYDVAAVRLVLGSARRLLVEDPAAFSERYPAVALVLLAGIVLNVLLLMSMLRHRQLLLQFTWYAIALSLTASSLLVEDSPNRMLSFLDHRIVRNAQARQVLCDRIQPWVDQAFRRPVDLETLELFAGIYDAGISKGLSYRQCIQSIMEAVLCSPEFIFRVEDMADPDQVARPLNGYELASRLSYFLWSSMPDAELFEAARTGQLKSDEELDRQVNRMLDDSRIRELSENFAAQWLKLSQVLTSRPDEARFSKYYEAGDADTKTTAGVDMMIEPVLVFETVMIEDRSILDFIAADYTYLNPRLAAIYNYESLLDTTASANADIVWHRVHLPDSTRGGLITMGAPLLFTSFPLRTSPVRRGAWILETVFNRPPQEPKMAAMLDADKEHDESRTIRQRFEEHRADPACATCHRRIDPPGFALECFDPIGAWRTHDGEQPVDTKAELMDGTDIDGPSDLKARIVEQPRDYVRGFVEHLLSFALGRPLGISDAREVNRIVVAASVDNYRFSTVLRETVKSRTFRFVGQQAAGGRE